MVVVFVECVWWYLWCVDCVVGGLVCVGCMGACICGCRTLVSSNSMSVLCMVGA